MRVDVILFHAVGIVLILLGIFLIFRKPGSGRNVIKFLGFEGHLSTPALVVMLFGIFLFVFPYTSLFQERTPAASEPTTALDLQAGAPADPSVYCEVADRRLPPADCEVLKEVAANVRPGAAAFNAPDFLEVGRPVQIQLVVDRRSPARVAALRRDRSAAAGRKAAPFPVPAQNPTPDEVIEPLGEVQEFTPPVGRLMRAELAGRGIEVQARSPSSREIPKGGQGVWLWSITGEEPGPQTLVLTTIVEGEAGGKRIALANTETVRRIEVRFGAHDSWEASSPEPASKEYAHGDAGADLSDRLAVWPLRLMSILAALGLALLLLHAFRRRRK